MMGPQFPLCIHQNFLPDAAEAKMEAKLNPVICRQLRHKCKLGTVFVDRIKSQYFLGIHTTQVDDNLYLARFQFSVM